MKRRQVTNSVPSKRVATQNPLGATSMRELEAWGFGRARRRGRSWVPEPIVPEAAARAVVQDAAAFLGQALPGEWVALLVEHAEELCAANADFRRRLNTKGNAGRDRLWAFMRHWLCAKIARQFPELHRRLPSEYAVGGELPERRAAIPPRVNRPGSAKSRRLRLARSVPLRRRAGAGRARRRGVRGR